MRNKITSILFGCIALSTPASAHAESFDFDPGMGSDVYNPNLAGSGGHPYDWYYQNVPLDYSSGDTDGSVNNSPYITFDGTDKSTAGHCLELLFDAPAAQQSPFPVEALAFYFIDSAGGSHWITQMNTTVSGYNVIRLWIQNTGSGLYWQTRLTDLDGGGGSWNQRSFMNIWRLDVNQAQCTGAGVISIKISGVTGHSTACRVTGTSCVSL